MVKLIAWFRRRGYAADIKHLSRNVATYEGRLRFLEHLVAHLKKCTFTGKPIVQVDVSEFSSRPIKTRAVNCDDLLISLDMASKIVEGEGVYQDYFYARREFQLVLPKEYFVDTNQGVTIGANLFTPKFLMYVQMLASALNEKVSEESRTAQSHLRLTSDLVEECMRVAQHLLAISDQRLIPPSA